MGVKYLGQVIDGNPLVFRRDYEEGKRDQGHVDFLYHTGGHSPDGYNWGYNGSGPADLAHSLLYDVVGEDYAGIMYTKYMNEVIAKWMVQDHPWEMPIEQIEAWVDANRTEVFSWPQPPEEKVLKVGCTLVVGDKEYIVEDYRSNDGQAEIVTRQEGARTRRDHYFVLSDVLRGLKDTRSGIMIK